MFKSFHFGRIQIYFKNMGLRSKLIFSYLVSILIPVLVFGGILYFISIGEIETEMKNMAFQSVCQVKKTIDEYIEQIDNISQMPYNDKELENYLLSTTDMEVLKQKYPNTDLTKVNIFLEKLMYIKKDIDFVSIISLDGKVITKSKYRKGDVSLKIDFFKEDIYKALRKSSGDMVLLPLHKSNDTVGSVGKVFSVGRRILSFTEGIYAGYVLIDCSEEVLGEICNGVNIGKSGFIAVVDSNNKMLYTSGKDYVNTLIPKILDVTDKKQSVSTIQGVSSDKIIAVSSTSEYSGLTVIGVVPFKDIVQRVSGIKTIFISLAAASIFLVFIFSIIISSGLVKPIRKLQNAMKTMTGGNTDLSVTHESNDEIGQLSNSFNQLIKRINILLTTIKSIEVKKREAELNALKSQINPHFLYNTLESIRMTAVVDGNKTTAKSVKELANYFRYTTQQKQDIIDIRNEIEQGKRYIYLQKIRYEDKFTVYFDIDEELLSYKTIKFTLQPIIENAICHGLEKKVDKGSLRISVKSMDNNIVFEVIDDGIGIGDIELERLREDICSYGGDTVKSVGLKNVNERIKLYFGEEYGLYIDSKLNEGTCVRLVIPAISGGEGDVADVIGFLSR